ncbi:chromosome condensation (RCC1) repeat [Rhizoctonia solani]|uniref:Chromosome condensation (RCC1) repeat n=1 Tax=Rhizoctonia solani TaxID=456999 RepID=A0A8H7I274_9AGAM|nr:chromosome condensation (RCC1) repeat [Rhizoctonia solani]
MPPRRLSVSVEIPVPPKSPHKQQPNNESPSISKNKGAGMPPPGKKRKRTHVWEDEEPPTSKTRQSSRPPASTASAREPSTPKSARASSVARSVRAPSVTRSARAPSVPRSTRGASVARSVRASSVPRSRAGSIPRSPRTPRRLAQLPPLKKPPFNPLPVAQPPTQPAMQLFVFGNGDMGQFGLGTNVLGDISRPRQHAWFKEAIDAGILGTAPGAGIDALCAGGMHTLVVDEVGRVWSESTIMLHWATDRKRDSPERPNEVVEAEVLETEPMVVKTLVDEEFRAVDVCAGDSISVALGEGGALRVWGSFRILPTLPSKLASERFTQVTCGTDHVLALTSKGVIVAWGNGQQAQLGRRIIERRKVNGLVPHRLALRKIKSVGSGSYHSFAVDHKGDVYAWGLNSMRQCGTGLDEDVVTQPTLVPSLSTSALGSGRRVVAIAGGEHHTIFLVSDGTVYACGRCDGFELGLGSDHPAMRDLEERKELGRKQAEEEWVRNGGMLQEMPPYIVDEYISEPVQVFFPPLPGSSSSSSDPSDPDGPPVYGDATTRISAISSGTRHNLAISTTGYAYSWGYGNQCQLGLGPDVEEQRVPKRIRWKGGDGWKVLKGAAGGQHCLLGCIPRE